MAKDCVMRCVACAHYRAEEDEFGVCHRFPPVAVQEGRQYSFAFPVVNEDDYCGGFQCQS
jgi:hypothetical protein